VTKIALAGDPPSPRGCAYVTDAIARRCVLGEDT